MPRHRRALAGAGALLICAVVPPPVWHAALAAAAGTLFEAAPFVLVAGLSRTPRLRALAFASGCGCRDGPLPGALALAPIVLAWLAFGPAVALGRAALAVALGRAALAGALGRAALAADAEAGEAGPSGCPSRPEPAAPGDVLARLVPFALGAALARDGVGVLAAALGASPAAWAARALAGAALGAMMPCATAGVAVAAGLRAADPAVALGLLATAGIGWRFARRTPPPARDPPTAPAPRAAPHAIAARAATDPAAYLALAALLAYLAFVRPVGFVTPRLYPLAALGAVAAVLHVRARTAAGSAWPACAVMFAALVLGAPSPPYVADATALERAFAGEPLAFAGVARHARGRTVLERYTITCCRIDARADAVALDRVLPVRDGAWIAASGTLVRRADGELVLRPRTWRSQPPPHDPFAYR